MLSAAHGIQERRPSRRPWPGHGIMLKCGTLCGLLLAGNVLLGVPIGAQGQDASDILTIDQLLSIGSVISGSPAWSSDGERILLTSSVAGGLATLPAEGGFPTLVPLNAGSAGHFLASQMPGWAPSGEWISYLSNKSGAPEIWLWSTKDGSEVQLTDLGARINSMTWSRDGRWIAFAGDRYGNYDVWKVSVPDGTVHRLTDDKRYEVFPTWTPDSRRILYVRLDETWTDHDVIEVDAGGATRGWSSAIGTSSTTEPARSSDIPESPPTASASSSRHTEVAGSITGSPPSEGGSLVRSRPPRPIKAPPSGPRTAVRSSTPKTAKAATTFASWT